MNETMKTSLAGRQFIQRFEQCRLKAYKCPAGVWTIGWGHTGPDVVEGKAVAQGTADKLFDQDIAEREALVAKFVTVPLNQAQFDAVVSAVYNIGAGSPGHRDGIFVLASGQPSTFLKLLNAGEYDQAADQLPRWNKSGGVVLNGLTIRRGQERWMFLGRPV